LTSNDLFPILEGRKRKEGVKEKKARISSRPSNQKKDPKYSIPLSLWWREERKKTIEGEGRRGDLCHMLT